MGESDSNFHCSTSGPGPSEPHVIPKQDQPSPSEPEIDLEALMELSIEEQKTQLEVKWGFGPSPQALRDGSWAWTKENQGTPISASLNEDNQFKGENPWEAEGGLWRSVIA